MSEINTDQFINNFNIANNSTSITKWIHDHPTAVKVMQVAAVILGAAAIAVLPLSLPVLGIAIAVSIAAAGAIAMLASTVSWLFLKYVTCKKHDIKDHVFDKVAKDTSCQPWARVYYKGDIPILEMDCDNSYMDGFTHGRLLGVHIHKLKNNLDLAIHGLMRQPKAKELPKTLKNIWETIPQHMQEEMTGLAEGFNAWANKNKVKAKLTTDDVLLMHLIPDSKHFQPKRMENDLLGTPACTTMLYRSDKEGMVFGRNMDWCPFGEGGENSIVMVWKKRGVAVLGTPGLIGAITGWNKHEECLAMNVCPPESTDPTKEVRGMPAIFYNRLVLEQTDSLKDVKEFTKKNRPLGIYHMTVADKAGEGACFSFYQGKDAEDHLREAEKEKPLTVLNWEYPSCKCGSFNSPGRNCLLSEYFGSAAKQIPADQINRRKLVDNALKLTPLVNSWITMHSLLFTPGEVQMGWDNGYAADMPKQHLRLTEVF